MTDTRSNAVLVLDDDALIRSYLEEVLSKAGHPVLLAKAPVEAKALLEKKPFVALLDVNLPWQQGDRFCRELRQDPIFWDLPVIMITGIDKSSAIHRCFVAGADDFAPKPLVGHQIVAKVEAVWKGLQAPKVAKSVEKAVLIAARPGYFSTLLRKLLENSGYSVHQAIDPGSAIDLFGRSVPIDLAVLDIDLAEEVPGGLLKALRSSASYQQIPVVGVRSDLASRKAAESWAEVTKFDADSELERIVRHANAVLSGSLAARNRRAKPRVSFNSIIRFRIYGEQEWMAAYGYDLSETGVFVRTLTPLGAGKPVEISFRLEDVGPEIGAKGLVIWSNPAGRRDIFSYPSGMGIAFSDFDAGEWTRLHEWIKARL